MKKQFNCISDISGPDYIVWDMDGTLTKPGMGRFVHSGMESNAMRLLRGLDHTFQTTRKMTNLVFPNLDLNREAKKKILSLVANKREEATLVLEQLTQLGIKHSIVSNNSREAVGDKFLNLLDMDQHFRSTYFAEDMDGFRKPNPRILQKMVQEQEIADDATIWIIGDSRGDMKLALNAMEILSQTIIPVAIGRTAPTEEFVLYSEGNYEALVVNDMSDIINLLWSIPEKSDYETLDFSHLIPDS